MALASVICAAACGALLHGARVHRGVTSGPPRRAHALMGEHIVVTDGTNSFYESRTLFQLLHDFGSFEAITASSTSVADAKKMLLSRQARYSGLVDVLKFSEDALGDVLQGASTWLIVNANEAALASQIAAAKAAGVKRIFVHVSAEGPDTMLSDAKALQTALEGSGAEFTVMRARVVKESSSASLILAGIDEPGLEEVPKEDTYRFITEALTLPEANGRLFSICPNEDDSQFREMRRAGCNRREEAQALLAGVISKTAKVTAEASAAAVAAAEAAKVPEVSPEEREAELKALLEKARVKGIENQKRIAEENAEKARIRAERQEKIKESAPKGGSDEPKAGGKDKDGSSGDDSPPPTTTTDPKGGGDGGDKPPEPPLALA